MFITGDIGHHEGIDSLAQGMAVIDAGHYGIEHIMIEFLSGYLKRNFPQIEIEEEKVKNPFQVL